MKKDFQHLIYICLLVLFVIFLPTSKYMTSLVQILMLIHWLIRGNLLTRLKMGFKLPALWVFLLIFFGQLIGMIYTSNFEYGLHDLKIKLPLLILPVILATSEKLTVLELKIVLLLFVAAVFAASLVSVGALLDWIPLPMEDFRDASLFISHIRFALLVDVSLFILTFYALRSGVKPWQKVLLYGVAFYFIGFLILSKAMTGIVVALIVGIILSLRWILTHSGTMTKWFALAGILLIPVFVSVYIGSKVSDFYTPMDDLEQLDRYTAQGNPYWHDSTNLMIENGYKVGLYWCEDEMKNAWPGKSDISYSGKDHKGQDLKYTLIRYLTSLGYRKDADGISKLNSKDIELIENGYANSIYRHKNRFHNRIYTIIWQMDVYKKGGNPSGHSLTQRLEYLKTGWSIINDHFFIGVGTGDVQDAFSKKYIETDSLLAPEWRLRAHNQWLTFGIALGFIGFLVMLAAFILPGLIRKGFTQYLFLLFFTIAFISMFNEDTLETQAGVAFVAFFYPLFLFAVPHEKRIR